jgi:hypothetical protein
VYSGLTKSICADAWRKIIEPAAVSAAAFETINKFAGCVVVLKPAIPYEPKYSDAINNGTFDELVLWQYDFANSSSLDALPMYIKIARAKAFTSYLTGLPSHLVQQQFPSLYVPGMTKWGGSAVAGVGPMRLITAFSGVQWNFDQMISEMMISAIQAMCHEGMRAVMESAEPMILPDL